MRGQTSPVGMGFMESGPTGRIPGRYDEKKHMWAGRDGTPILLSGDVTATGGNASTGAGDEHDTNSDFD